MTDDVDHARGPADGPVGRALARLQQLLPLAARQAALPQDAAAVHRAVLRGFAAHGQPPGYRELAQRFPGADCSAILRSLAERDLVVLHPANNAAQGPEVVGAYPFTLEGTPHVVRLGPCETHAMCAVDALAVSPLFDQATTVVSRCHCTDTPVHLRQDRMRILAARPSQNVRAGIAWHPPGQCAARSLCREMIFLRDEEVARAWVAEDASRREAYTLDETVALAAAFFRPLLRE